MSGIASLDRRMVDSAIELTRRKLPVFPLTSPLRLKIGGFVCSCGTARCDSPAKHPMARLAPRGVKNASADPATVRHWWSIAPLANIGLATGPVVVLDIDPRHGGDESLSTLERQHGTVPHTWRVLTGGGGEHIYFAVSQGSEIRNSAGRLGQGLDIRGVGGYVVAPPSVHISGHPYAWSVDHHPDHAPLALMPGWMVHLLLGPAAAGQKATVQDWRELVTDGVQDGCRNTAVARLTGHLLRRYVDPELAHQLIQAWNIARCRPPLSQEEVTRTVGSIAKRELKRREAQLGRTC